VGIGAAPNRSLTRYLARAGRGVELMAGDAATAVECAGRLRAATARPVLTDLRFGGSALVGLAPAKPRDVLAGQPLVLAAEIRPEGGTIEAAGNLAGRSEVWGWRMEVVATGSPGIVSTPLPIGALYGREAIADLEAEAMPGGSKAEVIDGKIEKLGLRHQITSRRTSLVAITEEPTTDPKAPRRRERLPVELPADVSAEGVGLFEAAGTMAMLGGPRFIGAALTRSMAPMERRTRWGKEMIPGVFLGATGKVTSLAGVVIHRDGDEIVLEIETPEDGFILPSGEAAVLAGDREVGKARVVPEKSTPPGPHARGVLVRLALRLEGGSAWPEVATILFERRSWRGLIDRLGILANLPPEGEGSRSPARSDPPVA